MKLICLLVAFIFAGILTHAAQDSQNRSQFAASPSQLAHVRHTFEFTVHAAQRSVAPLFGAHLERVWAAGWDPQFVYPQPPEDKAGAVFTVAHGGHTSTWITTIFEPEKGRIQHVYFIPGALVTLIDIHLTSPSPSETRVQVAYERTALAPEANDHVRQLGEADERSGGQWQSEIENYLKRMAQNGHDNSK